MRWTSDDPGHERWTVSLDGNPIPEWMLADDQTGEVVEVLGSAPDPSAPGLCHVMWQEHRGVVRFKSRPVPYTQRVSYREYLKARLPVPDDAPP